MFNEEELLAKLGIKKTDYVNYDYCGVCNHKGYLLINNYAKICSCAINKTLKELYIAANIPAIYLDLEVDDWTIKQDGKGNDLNKENQQKSIFVKKFFNFYLKKIPLLFQSKKIKLVHTVNEVNYISSLLLKGPSGSGKTFFAAMCAKETIKYGYLAMFLTWSDLVSKINGYGTDINENIQELEEIFSKYDLIIIDEFYDYKINNKPFIFNLDLLFSKRLQTGKPVIVTSTEDVFLESSGPVFKTFISESFLIKLPLN